jgi:hypothetical protein
MTSMSSTLDGIITSFSWDDELEALYRSWRGRVEAAGRAHAELADRSGRRNEALAVLAVSAIALGGALWLAPIVAPDAYARATARIDRDLLSVAGALLAGIAAVLVVVQSAARFAVRAERHRLAALRFASLGRAMDVTAAMPRDARGAPDLALEEVRRRVDRYTREAPRLGPRRRRELEAAFDHPPARHGEEGRHVAPGRRAVSGPPLGSS